MPIPFVHFVYSCILQWVNSVCTQHLLHTCASSHTTNHNTFFTTTSYMYVWNSILWLHSPKYNTSICLCDYLSFCSMPCTVMVQALCVLENKANLLHAGTRKYQGSRSSCPNVNYGRLGGLQKHTSRPRESDGKADA